MLTLRQIEILKALARFKYMTTEQIVLYLGLKHIGYCNTCIKDLKKSKKHPLMQSLEFGIMPKHGKLSRVHYLTQRGANLLIDELGYEEKDIKKPKGRSPSFRVEYFHRVSMVQFNVHFQMWCDSKGYKIDFFNYDFDSTGGNNSRDGKKLRSLNCIPLNDYEIRPDGIGLFSDDTRPYLFLFEQHNGKDRNRAIEQMTRHAYCLAQGTASEMYGVDTASRIYYVFENETCRDSTIREFAQHDILKNFSDFFYFKTNEELNTDFYNGWLKANGQRQSFI